VGGEIFRTCPDRPWGQPSLLYNGYRVFPGGKERPGRDADPSPPYSAVGHKRVELHLYSPYRPYGLYRASVPVQGCPFTFYLCTVSHLLAINIHNLLRLSFYQRLVLKNRVLWDVPSCRCINSPRRFRESLCLHLQGQAVCDEVINFYFNFMY